MKNFNWSRGNLMMCLVELIIGILLLINPIGFTSAIIRFVGVILIVLGALSILKYFRTEPEIASWEGSFSKGLIFLLAGLFCVMKTRWFLYTFPLLTVIYGVIVLVAGITKLQWSIDMFRVKHAYWYLAAISAALSIVFAMVILVNPFRSTAFLWTFIGVTLIVEAVVDILTSILGR